MKKAKRLLAIFLAFIMICSAASVSVYAKMLPDDDYTTPKVGLDNRYKFDVNQGASYILDMLDNLLADANIYLTWKDLGIDGYLWLLGTVDIDGLDLRSIDAAVVTIWTLKKDLDEAALVTIADFLTAFGNILDNLTNEGLNKNINRRNSKDIDVLYMVLNWLNNMRPMLKQAAASELDLGLIGSFIDNIDEILGDLDGFLTKTLYTALIDDTATTVTPGMLNAGVQNLVNWLLIGTGSDAATGANSLVGPNKEGLFPAIADQPGGAGIYADPIVVDRNEDGVMENATMSFYQLVNNLIQALLNGMAIPLLTDVLYDALDIEITEDMPGGDPEILQDEMFVMITGLIENLAVQNGAPAPKYTEEDNATPAGKVSALLNWFFNGGGLDTFIKIDYYGFKIQDNFMSLLNDVARLAINLLPGLGLEVNPALGYTADELNQVWYYDANKNLVEVDAEGAIDKTYVTYEDGTVVYAAEFDDKGNPTAYNVLATDLPLDTGAGGANASLIRQNYVISKDNVYACLIKMVLDMVIEGCYFPEWADTMNSVLAYGLASIGVVVLPENNYFARLDLYHQNGNTNPVQIQNAKKEWITVTPISYDGTKTDPDSGEQVQVPYGAMKIGADIGAFYLNGLIDNVDRPFATDSSFDRLLTELVIWALENYGPILCGTLDATTGKFTGNGMWQEDLNNLITATYSNFTANQARADAQWTAVYTFLDKSLFGLIPASWLPGNLSGSFDLINSWLLNSLVNLNLQQILSLFSVNETGELNESVMVVLLRVIDRVLATVFNGTPVLLNTSRTDVYTQHTDITDLEKLISGTSQSDSLPMLLDRLVYGLFTYKHELCSTIFPLILGTAYNKPFNIASETNYLGSDMTKYTVETLEGYVDFFETNVNADLIGIYNTEEEAQACIDAIHESDKYASLYIRENVAETMIIDEEVPAEVTYEVWQNRSYRASATRTPATDDAGEYAIYSNFQYADLVWRTDTLPFVNYENVAFRFYEAEDWQTKLYLYNNLNDALKDGAEYASTYRSFPKYDLPAAYQEWMHFIIEARLWAADRYDSNGDGRSVISETDTDYVAPTTDDAGNVTNPGFPVDSQPTPPAATVLYPFYDATSSDTHPFYAEAIGQVVNIQRNTLTESQFEQLAMALEFATHEENYVDLDILQMEKVGRLALNTIDFDISADASGNYFGSIQWEDLNDAQLTTIKNTCTSLSIVFTYDVAAGEYSMKMCPFATFKTNSTIASTVSPVPTKALHDVDGDLTFEQKIENAIYQAYSEYVQVMYRNRQTLYNKLDLISDRAEEANLYRATDYSQIDVETIVWALNHTAHAYKSANNLRNAVVTGAVNGEIQTKKVYTAGSYEQFREAYDYAESLRKASVGEITSRGVTQSMVSYAYRALMNAYNALVIFTGPADFTQLLNYVNVATDIKNDPLKDDPELGYTPDSYNALVSELVSASEILTLAQNETIDCESQDKVDKAAADLYEKINALVYNTAPKLKPAVDEAGNNIVETIVMSEGNRVIGHIFGLTVGKGVSEDQVEVVGMRIEEGVGNSIGINESGRGFGTGAYITGKVSSIEKFRFYAIVYGDINGDAMIDGTDRSAIELAIMQGTNTSTDMGSVKFEAADVNHDGFVNASDANTIEQYYNYNPDAVIDQGDHNPVVVATAE